MSHFAKIENGIVTQVIVVEQDFINTGVLGDPSLWVQTSYNTLGGKHLLGSTPLRGNYAGVGYTYDKNLDVFIPPQPYASWILNETTYQWEAPINYPNDNKLYKWDEAILNWSLILNEGEV
jgi:hypothetical protein